MEILSKNHPRFCARYISKVGVAKEIKVGWDRVYVLNGQYYMQWQHCSDTLPLAGQIVLIANKVALPNDLWELHNIVMPECYWAYLYFANKSAKSQRTVMYTPNPGIGSSGKRMVLHPISESTFNRLVAKNKN